jgi:hypothetical protein
MEGPPKSANGTKTHCPHGHVYDDKNTTIVRSRGVVVSRKCRACQNAANYRNKITRYGLTPATYEALLAAQGGKCACCGVAANRDGRRMFIDHDHATGMVRGILCNSCNLGIGALGDSVDGVRRALAYLERAHNEPRGQP